MNTSSVMKPRCTKMVFGCIETVCMAVLLFLFHCLTSSAAAAPGGRITMSLSGGGWHLWQDREAVWQNDRLWLPDEVTDLRLLPVNPPTDGWQRLDDAGGMAVSVPGTVEEYMTRSERPQPADNAGVSWWWRKVCIPAEAAGRRVVIHFESVRMRAEVYLDGRLVAYDVVGESPFCADITDAVTPGHEQTLAVRVTNPGGNFHWQDFEEMHWGKYIIPPGRGFGGIIGRVWIDAVTPVYIDDIYMQNLPQATTVRAVVTVKNTAAKAVRRDVVIGIREKSAGKMVKTHTIKSVLLSPGDNTVEAELDCSGSGVRLWDLDNPALYACDVAVKNGRKTEDDNSRTFGFRWFSPEGIGRDAVLRLNGRRVMLRTAISWGYWPATGLYATPEMAVRQIKTAQSLGMNMLNFHRSIGSPVVLEAADSLGLLYYEEPGAFHSAGHDPFVRAIVNTKLQRMVRRDRSHPSLVIYNLINEFGGVRSRDKELVAKRMDDMRKAHAIDPSRVMTFTSGWASRENSEEDSKAHMLPYDTVLYRRGWFDNHRAGGPATWEEGYWRGPNDNFMHTDNRTEVFMRGEEGALSTPPRIAKIAEEMEKTGVTGWDGLFWKSQMAAFEDYFNKNNLAPYFGTVDSLTRLLGDISLDHQGRRIQGMRMQNTGDVYAVNGWESMPYDNHSGIVDNYRNVKGNLSTFTYYTQPLYIAVAARTQFVRLPGGKVAADFYIVNEKDVKGRHRLTVSVIAPDGNERELTSHMVDIAGGDTFGQLLIENEEIVPAEQPGMHRICARLTDDAGRTVAEGHDDVLAVAWQKEQLRGRGAIYGRDADPVAAFYKNATGRELPEYRKDMGRLDWLVVTRSSLDEPQPMPEQPDVDGRPAFSAVYYKDDDMRAEAGTGTDTHIDRTFVGGEQPHASLAANQSFSIVWKGKIRAPKTGTYLFGVAASDGVRLSVNGGRIVDEWGNNRQAAFSRPVTLKEGETAEIELQYRQRKPSGNVRLLWSLPGSSTVAPEELLDRVSNDGTSLIVIESADSWMDAVARYTGIPYHGYYVVDRNWIGGVHFVKDHPLFRGLPVNCGMGWPYQELVRDGDRRTGFLLDGGEMVAGSYRSWPFHLGSAVGIIPCGKGRVIYSTLNISSALNKSTGAAEVAKKLFCNFIEEAAR